jgi:hypothetical protein
MILLGLKLEMHSKNQIKKCCHLKQSSQNKRKKDVVDFVDFIDFVDLFHKICVNDFLFIFLKLKY